MITHRFPQSCIARGRQLALPVATVCAITACGGQSGAARDTSPFAFRASASSPTVLAEPNMRKLFGLVYGENFPTGNARTLAHDLAHGPAIDIFASTDRRALRRLQHAGTIEKPIPFATQGDSVAYLALIRRSHKKKAARAFIATVLESQVYMLHSGFTPLPARPARR